MPVRFKGSSEYDRNFKWETAADRLDDPTVASWWAGLRSDELGVTKEPSFPSKKKVPYYNPQISKSFQWPNGKEIQEKEQVRKRTEPVKVHLEIDKDPLVEEDTHTPDAPRLLRRPRSHSVAPRDESADSSSQVKRALVNLREQKNDALPVSGESPPKEHSGVQRVLQKKAGLKVFPSQHPLRMSEYKRQFDKKSRVDNSPLLAAEQVVYNKNQAVPPFRVKPVNTETEYNSQFKGSPPAKGPKLRKCWEEKYIHEFEPENQPPKRKDKKKSSNTILHTSYKTEKAKVEQNEDEKRKILRERLVQHLDFPAKAYRKVKSEYSANFLSPSAYKYKDGAWVRANKEILQQGPPLSLDSMWVAEVKELREKAAYYKHRAQGTHFSRDHLNQILSASNRMWDASSNSSSEEHVSDYIKALDLAGLETSTKNEKLNDSQVKVKSAANTGNLGISAEPTLPAVRRRLVWDKEEDNEPVRDTGTPEEANEHADSPPLPPSEQMEDAKADEVRPETVEEKLTKRLEASKLNSPSDGSDSASICSGVDGRLPTPKLKTFGISQRTHHDLTTPASGGALLVSPPKHHGRVLEEKTKGSSGRHPSPNKPASRSQKSSAKTNGELASQSPPAAGIRTVDPIPLRQDEWPSSRVHDRPCSLVFSNPASGSPAPKPSASLPQQRSPSCRIHGALRDPEFQHNGDFGVPAFYKTSLGGDHIIEDDRLSQISARSAASSSFASQILERAQKRKEHFWGKK